MNVYSVYSKKPDLIKYLELFLSFSAVIIFSVFAIRPTSTTILALIKEIKAKEEMSQKLDTKIANLKKAQALYGNEREKIQLINEAIPDNPSPQVVVRQIEAVSEQNSLNPTSITLGSATLKGEAKSTTKKTNLPKNTSGLVISFSGKGAYENMKTIATILQNMRRPLVIENLSIIKRQEEDKGSYSLLFNISGQLPYYQPNTIGKVTANKENTDNAK